MRDKVRELEEPTIEFAYVKDLLEYEDKARYAAYAADRKTPFKVIQLPNRFEFHRPMVFPKQAEHSSHGNFSFYICGGGQN